MTRREWVRACLASAGGASLYGLPTAALAQKSNPKYPHYSEIKFLTHSVQRREVRKERNWLGQVVKEHINMRTQYAFSDKQKQKLKDGLIVTARRLLDPKILRVALHECSLFAVSGIKNKSGKWKWAQFEEFVKRQFQAMRQSGIPLVHVTAWDSDKFSGRAGLGEYVVAEVVETNGFTLVPVYRMDGVFRIEMSVSFLDKATPDAIAGTIAHEMLHQMGHSHPNGYLDNNFITVFGDVLMSDGTYFRRKDKDEEFGLRGRSGWMPCGA